MNRLFFFCEPDADGPVVERCTVKGLNGSFGTGIVGHGDKGVTFAFAGVFVRNDRDRIDRSVYAE